MNEIENEAWTMLVNSRRRAFAWKRRNSPYIFQVVASLPTKACSQDTKNVIFLYARLVNGIIDT